MSKIQKVAEVFRSRFLKKVEPSLLPAIIRTQFNYLYNEIDKQIGIYDTEDIYEDSEELLKFRKHFIFLYKKISKAIDDKDVPYMKSLGKEIFKNVTDNPKLFTNTENIFKYLKMFFDAISRIKQ